LEGSDLLAAAPIKSALCIKNAQRERKGEAEVWLAKVPPRYLLNTLEAISGGVAMDAE
jgi:hypothetical protein